APSAPARQPLYEPGYDGPPRFVGAPRGHGDIPQDELSSYPYGPRDRRPASPYAENYPDRRGSGPRGIRPGPPPDMAGPAHRPAPRGRPEFRPDTSAQNRSDDSVRPGTDAAGWSGPAA